jgi:hypothetical protein
MRPLLESMPVRVVLNERAALLGAARWATLAGLLFDPQSSSGVPAGTVQ